MIDIGPDQVESFKLLTTALTKIQTKNESYYDMLTLTTIILFKRILFLIQYFVI